MSDRAACMYMWSWYSLSFVSFGCIQQSRKDLACGKHLSLSHNMVSPNSTVNFCVAVVHPFTYTCVGFFLLKPRSIDDTSVQA